MPHQGPNVTIREVAAAADGSRMTVTRVTRRNPQVTDTTRAAVEGVIRRMGCEPMQSARSLSSSKPRVIGVISLHSAETVALGLGSEYLTTLHLGALQVCNEANCSLISIPSLDAESVGTFLWRVHTRQLFGLRGRRRSHRDARARRGADRRGHSLFGHQPAQAAACPMHVLGDDRQAVRRHVEEVPRQGHRRIAFAGAGGHARAHAERHAGYIDAIGASGSGRLRPLVIASKRIAFADGLAIGRALVA